MNNDDPAGVRRQPPRFVPTLTEVVDGLHQALAAEPSAAGPAAAPLMSGQATIPVKGDVQYVPPVASQAAHGAAPAPKEWPVDAMVETMVDRALEELLARLADRLELHLASRMAQWRNEQAQQWVLEWLHAEMDGQLSTVRLRMEQLAREVVRQTAGADPQK